MFRTKFQREKKEVSSEINCLTAYLHITKIVYMQKWHVANMVYEIITKFAYIKNHFKVKYIF